MAGKVTAAGDALCTRRQSLLLVVDVQTRLMAAMPPVMRSAVLSGASRLLRAADQLQIPTVISEQYPRGLGATEATLLQQQPKVCERIEKTAFSVRGVPAFDQLLRLSDRRQVVVCGVEAHICVLQSALHLQRDGFAVFVVADAVCSRRADHRTNALARMQSAGIVVSNVESVLFEWLGDAAHPAFRNIATMIQ